MATYKDRMDNLSDLHKSFEFTPAQLNAARSYKVGEDYDDMKPATNGSERRRALKEEQDRKKRILEYIKNARESAIKRGMYNQSVYSRIEAEAQKNV